MKLKRGFLFFVCVLAYTAPCLTATRIGIISDLTHSQVGLPGETYETTIFIKNFSDSETGIKVYQRDYSYNCDGDQFYHHAGALERSNSGWILLDPHEFVIPAGETGGIKCVVQIPNDPTLVGTYWSLVMIEPTEVRKSSDGQNAVYSDEANFDVSPAKRYAIQVITHIGGTGNFQLDFVGTRFLLEENKRFLQIDVKNSGQRWLRPALYVEIYDRSGEYVSKSEGGKWRIYPGTSVRYRVDVSNLPPGEYNAMIIADNLDEHIFGMEYSLRIFR